MKKIIKKGLALSLSKGFTLIEMLIVIALLGALAIGLIGALDPFEQLKKGTDTGTRNTVSEIHSAIIRYYALKERMPWCTEGTELVPRVCHAFPEGEELLSSVAMSAAVDEIMLTGELKSNFKTMQSGQLGKVFVYGSAVGTDVTVCYMPGSKSFLSDKNSVWTDGKGIKELPGAEATCKGNGATGEGAIDCLWCVQ